MSIFDRAKTLTEIAELGSRVYAVIVDRSRAAAERDRRIRELETQVAELKGKIK